jgi:hypothetical protein
LKTTGNEYPPHIKAKERLKAIIEEKGLIADYEIGIGSTETEIGQRDYTVDLFAFWTNARTGITKRIAFEIDGKYHNSKTQLYKMRNRDKALLNKGIYTVRLRTGWLVGRGKVDDETIWNEILYQLK